ncbi:MAG: hypothetical protein BM557_07295 [Flavobacterium sp. MedPE-SWcel]|uniref:T9SS type A sorting domain-containing protein n=1 Tax=uncultured Flavobacterium sp. TaxID=165435 RepID=UPI000912847E|nr:T9SS type A sorting domain-containing protein [uncultured Flavobacterium sp.]OIQ18717.1 MAG: hypothetical protein BM557_07295 [Flavobacterium sp. MedPE-SWcel]
MVKQLLSFLVILFYTNVLQAQCTIPNGDFESWEEITQNTIYLGDVTYHLPTDGWTEGAYSNIVPRMTLGEGFFGRYEGNDTEGYALLLKRGIEGGSLTSQNHGFTIIECVDIPNFIVGKYKFSGSSEETVNDFFLVGAFAYKDENYTQDDLDQHIAQIANENFVWLALLKADTFQEFEIDLSVFEGQEIDRIMIQVVMIADGAAFLGTPDYASAVIDDITFIYDALSVNSKSNKSITVYPNPVIDVVHIESEEYISKIQVYNILGSLVLMQQNSSKINLSHLKKGTYFLSVITNSNKSFTKKVLKI